MKKYLKVLSAAGVTGTLRVKCFRTVTVAVISAQ